MKFAFCLYRYFPFGGLQRDFLRIAKECIARGHSVEIFTMSWEGDIDPDLTLHLIKVRGWQNHTRAQHFVSQVQMHLKQNKFDLVVGFNKMPGLDIYYAADTCYQAKSSKKHGWLYTLTPRYKHSVQYEAAVFSQTASTKILMLSSSQQLEFTKYYSTPPQRFHLLPPGITKDRIAASNASQIRELTRKEFNIKQNEFLLLMVGSGFKTKGLDRILIGICALPHTLQKQCHLLIVGEDKTAIFIKQAKKLKIIDRVKFLGGRKDVPNLLLASDLLLHPAYNENTGTVLLEALASGLPVLTTDVCGYAHYITTANAGKVLTSPFSQKEFNSTLQNMLLSEEKITWQTNGLQFAKQSDIYSMPQYATDIIETMRSEAYL